MNILSASSTRNMIQYNLISHDMGLKMRGNIEIGSKVNRLTVVGKTMRGKRPELHWICKCDCGSDKVVYARNSHLINGAIKSCGCLHREKSAARAHRIRVGWETTCAVCGKQFHAVSNKQNVCSSECRFALYQNKGSASECWEWAGPKNLCGYGALFLNQNKASGKRDSVPAHRYSYELNNGPIPEGMCVMHTCDNPSCTNPAHLQVGTWGENNSDRSRKGRSGKRVYSSDDLTKYANMQRGEKCRFAKLTAEQAKAIKYDHPDLSTPDVAKLYGVGHSCAWQIRTGRTWSHL